MRKSDFFCAFLTIFFFLFAFGLENCLKGNRPGVALPEIGLGENRVIETLPEIGLGENRAADALSEISFISGRGALDEIAEGIRIFMADMLWMKVDQYHHSFKGIWKDDKDVLPLIRWVTLLNPHLVDAYITGGHHLLFNLNRKKQGLAFLEEGIKLNKNDERQHEIIGELAFYYLLNGDEEKSVKLLYFALNSLPSDYFDETSEFLNRDNYIRMIKACWDKLGEKTGDISDLKSSLEKTYPQLAHYFEAAQLGEKENFPDSQEAIHEHHEYHEYHDHHDHHDYHEHHDHDEICPICGHHHGDEEKEHFLGSMHAHAPFPWNRKGIWPEKSIIQASFWLIFGIVLLFYPKYGTFA